VAREDCPDLGSGAAHATVFGDAVATGQVALEAIDHPLDGVAVRCADGRSTLYAADFPLSYLDACGEFRIEAEASTGEGVTSLAGTFDVVCFDYIDLDFDVVDWGAVREGVRAAGSAMTMTNRGNSGVAIALEFTSLELVPASPPSATAVPPGTATATGVAGSPGGETPTPTAPAAVGTAPPGPAGGGEGRAPALLPEPSPGATPDVRGTSIGQFDACFGRDGGAAECLDGVTAGTVVSFGNDREHVLCAGEVGHLQLAIHPPAKLQAGRYQGSLRVITRPAPDVCAAPGSAAGSPAAAAPSPALSPAPSPSARPGTPPAPVVGAPSPPTATATPGSSEIRTPAASPTPGGSASPTPAVSPESTPSATATAGSPTAVATRETAPPGTPQPASTAPANSRPPPGSR
jgi:hypothetical protein